MPPIPLVAIIAILLAPVPVHSPDRVALNDIVGTWQSDTVGGTSARSVCAASPGGMAVICEQRIFSPTGARTAVNIFMVDSAANRYAYYGINQVGTPIRPAELAISDHIWIYGGNPKGADGKYSRTVNDFSAGTWYVWRVETSADGVNWTTVRQGRAVRQ